MFYVLLYLVSIILANLSVAYFGPISTPFNAFFLIGLDLSLRDKLHETWHGQGLKWKMFGLIAAGGYVTWLLNRGAGQVCIASVVAFSAALLIDTVIYERLIKKDKFIKMNGSNIGSAAADSILFPTIAFGALMPWIVIGQFVAKVVGGALWVWILTRKRAVTVPKGTTFTS